MIRKASDCKCDFCIYVYRGKKWKLAKPCIKAGCRCPDIKDILGEKRTEKECQGEVFMSVPCTGSQECQTNYCTYQCVDNKWKKVPGADCPQGCTCPQPNKFLFRWKQGTILMVQCKAKKQPAKKSVKKSARGAKKKVVRGARKGTVAKKKKGKRAG